VSPHVTWNADGSPCRQVLLPYDPLPVAPAGCLAIDVGEVSAALLAEVDEISARVPVLLSLEPGVRLPDMVFEHVVALKLGGGRYDSEPLPPRTQFPAVRYLHAQRSQALPDGGWLEADEVSLGIYVDDPEKLGTLGAIADRIVALEVHGAPSAELWRAAVAALPNLHDVVFATYRTDPALVAALPDTISHLATRHADDEVVRAAGGLPHLRSLALSEARLDTLAPLAGAALRHLSVREGELGEAAVAELSGLRTLERLDLHGTPVGDGIAEPLASLSSLQALDLENTGVGDRTAAAVGGLAALRELVLARTSLGDAGVTALEPLSALRSLSLRGTQITSAALAHVPPVGELDMAFTGVDDLCSHRDRLGEIRALNLSGSRVGDEGTRCLTEFAHLATLSLTQTDIGDPTLSRVAELRGLRRLDVAGTGVGDPGIAKLRTLPNLRALDLSGLPITDASVEVLVALGLQFVALEGTGLGEAARERVRASLDGR